MKKLASLVFLSLLATAASAQSTVTIFGVIDTAVSHITGTGVHETGLSTGGANISRFGFRGNEDLGGGLGASFWLEAGLNTDDGTGKATGGGLSFNRRATVSLTGSGGEVRLGRDDSATFLSTLIFDPFLTNGVAGNNAFVMNGAPIQISNAISYFAPRDLGGFYGQVQHIFGEQSSTAAVPHAGDMNNIRLGYANGPLNMAAAAGKLKGTTSALDVKIWNVAAWYAFPLVRPSILVASESRGGVDIKAVELGATAAVGVGEIRAQVSRYDTSGSNADWRKFGLGYGYNLSKRTQLYVAIARVNNSAGAQKAIGLQGLTTTGTSLGGSSSGIDLGIRHVF